MTSAEPKTGMPKWLKIVLIVGGVFVVITIGIIIAVVCFSISVAKDVQDPVKIQQVASRFMTVKDPLPEGFKYEFGIDLFGNKFVGVENKNKDLKLVFSDFQQFKDLDDPETAINKIMQNSKAASGGGAHSNVKFESEKKGSEKVGGRKMTYSIGKLADKEGKVSQALIGLFEPTDSGTAVLFGSTHKENYDMEDTDTFLKSIEKI